ncbi:hypothetical protein SOCE26_030500 [Sorangium cellulosum]|uniref:Probable sensor domain-containing protein n=1 Tax=Sorangium cellulosum TaxID=56 RepID=A0A2L0EQQ5_SORCE|nr:diadenylate cyclase [Sorangium cellulosum]AUX41629.1 hypothetical protein SOCE26_030500 [Sorangium cellulosum]
MRPKYPSDVAAAFVELDTQSQVSAQRVAARSSLAPGAAPPDPPVAVLTRLIETMFFASTATEEGRSNPVGAVFAGSLAAFECERPSWDLVRLASAVAFDVQHVANLASACAWPRSCLAVVPQEGGAALDEALVIAGMVTPHRRQFSDLDQLVRVVAPKPGVVAVFRGEWEIVRYERGALRTWMPKHRPHLDSIEKAVLRQQARPLIRHVRNYLLRVVDGMVELGRGGLLAILGPGEGLPQLFCEDGNQLDTEVKRLSPPLGLGAALLEMSDAHTADAAQDARHVLEKRPRAHGTDHALHATERVHRMLDQIVRMTTVDGAVVMSHCLDVLAFGAKLPPPKAIIAEVFTATPNQRMDESWALDARGTRHRAAAAFVAGYPERIAFIVSQDGNAATFQEIDGKVVYWPL